MLLIKEISDIIQPDA